MKLNNKTIIIVVIVIAAVAWSAARSYQPDPPRPDRPVLTVIARLAKTLLWMAFFADPPPERYDNIQSAAATDGEPRLDHRSSL